MNNFYRKMLFGDDQTKNQTVEKIQGADKVQDVEKEQSVEQFVE